MRPNESGGQILENHLECGLVLKSLTRAGETELADILRARLDASGHIPGNIIPDLLPAGHNLVLEIDKEEVPAVISVLEDATEGTVAVDYPFESMLADAMINRYNGLPTMADELKIERERQDQKRRILPSLRKLVFRS